MKQYDDYQVVAQKWIDEIPEHWDFYRIKRIFAQRVEKNDPVITENILSLTAKQGVVPIAEKEGAGGNKPKGDMTQYNVARPDDLLVNCMNIVSGSAGVSRYFGAISPVYYALYPRLDCNVWYYHYLFRLMPFQRSLLGLGKGILMHESDSGKLNTVRMRISMDYLGNVPLPVPPRAEQDQIVRYLDWQVSKINRLIAAKKRQINTLTEYRKAKIDQIILHGDAHSSQKDSGIWWLRDIPQSWQVLPLKRICQVNASVTNVAKHLSDDEMLTFLPMESVSTKGIVNYSEKRRLADVRSGYSSFAKNDVVIAKITPCFENGKGACLDAMGTDIGYGTTEFINLRATDRILPRYLYMITMTQPFRKLGEEVMTGSAGQKRVPIEFIKGFSVGIPPINEQTRLLSLLNDITMRIDSQMESYNKSIISLQELRTRLISDVITGQIDVRDVEIPDFEYSPETDDNGEDVDEEESDDMAEEEV